MYKIKKLAIIILFSISPEFLSAETLGEFPNSNTLWIPITLNLEIDDVKLKFGAPHLRQNAFKKLSITEITQDSYQNKRECEIALMDVCKSDNCDVESLSVGNTDQFVFRNFFPKTGSDGKTDFVMFAFCRPYKIFFNDSHEIFKSGF